MFGPTPDIDNSFAPVTTRDVVNELKARIASLEIENENLKQDAEASRKLSLRPLVLLHEHELKDLRLKLNLSVPVPGELSRKRVTLWDDECGTLSQFITDLLKGAHEIL